MQNFLGSYGFGKCLSYLGGSKRFGAASGAALDDVCLDESAGPGTWVSNGVVGTDPI